jgi:hypothetical protein
VADLQVDLDGLAALAGTLGRIGERLEGARSELRGAGPELGDEQVVAALERFEQRWRDGRKDIRENGEALATMLTESVRTYRQVDSDLAAGLSVGQTGPRGVLAR